MERRGVNDRVNGGGASAAHADDADGPAPHTNAASAAARTAPTKAAQNFATSLGTTGAPMPEGLWMYS